MVVLKRNIVTCAADKISVGNKVLLTTFSDETAYQDKSF
jgi:hypothetical protein